jgi:cellobiose-specific phosphotransferase system component IIA
MADEALGAAGDPETIRKALLERAALLVQEAERVGRMANDDAERLRREANEAIAEAHQIRVEPIDDEDTADPT